MPNTQGAVDLGVNIEDLSAEEQEALNRLADEHEEDTPDLSEPNIRLGFCVIVDPQGRVQILASLPPGLISQYTPDPDEIIAVLGAAKDQLHDQRVASVTIQLQMQQMQAARQQYDAAQINRKIQESGGLRG